MKNSWLVSIFSDSDLQHVPWSSAAHERLILDLNIARIILVNYYYLSSLIIKYRRS